MKLSCDRVSYSYSLRAKPVLKEISFSIGTGVTGLLGPNGAGKSTLMALLATLARPSRGEVSVAGHVTTDNSHLPDIRADLGYLPQAFELMNGSSVFDNVAYSAWAHGVAPADVPAAARAALESVDLDDRPSIRVRKLSGGQRQRLGIACAMVHRPKIVILDEPTVGVDPLQRLEVRRVVAALGHTATVLISTHLVEDISRMASHLLVLNEGELLYDGSCDDFAQRVDDPSLERSVAIETAFSALVGGA